MRGSIVTAGATGRYIRIYHNDSYVEGPQGHELGLTGIKVYDAGGRDLASGKPGSIGADGGLVAGTAGFNSNQALTDAIVGGGWNQQMGEAGNVAYARGVKAYIELDLGSVQSIDVIRLWGDAGWAIDSKNLRVYLSNDAFDASSKYARLAGAPSVAHFDLAEAEIISEATSYPDISGAIDTLAGIENLAGSAMNDWLTGDANANVLSGGAGNDTLNGGAGEDTLNGGADNDMLNGEAGNDILYGSTGNDMLDGGTGGNTVDYSVDLVCGVCISR